MNIALFDKFKRSEAIKTFFVQFGLNGIFDELIDLLIDDKRITLLIDVLEFIVRRYKSDFNIMDFVIVSSHQLTDKEQNQIKNFLERKTKKKVQYKIKVDPNLIAGLKIYSETLLWEHSIYSQLTSLLKD
jgi:F-type H+-transporting ATPase subunit delta